MDCDGPASTRCQDDSLAARDCDDYHQCNKKLCEAKHDRYPLLSRFRPLTSTFRTQHSGVNTGAEVGIAKPAYTARSKSHNTAKSIMTLTMAWNAISAASTSPIECPICAMALNSG